jgi:hypothetical protein
MSKVGSHDPFGHLKHKLWPKERPKVKLAIWLPTTKSQESPNFLVFRWRMTYHWEALNKGYNFVSNLISIGGLHTKLWDPKVVGVPTLAISWLPFGSLRTKCHWMWALWRGTKYTIRGKVVASPKSGPWWVLWIRIWLWLVLVLQQCINQLVV